MMSDWRQRPFLPLLVTLALPLGAAPPSEASEAVTACRLHATQPAKATDRSLESLRGEAAREHLRNLLAKRSEAYARSRANLRQRGFLPTEIVVVHRTARTDVVERRRDKGLRLAQDHYDSNDDGEVVFWSWDDGDDTTWEGSFYAERYSDGAWLMVDVQVDIATEDYLTLWASETGTSWEVLNQEAFSTGPLDLRRAVLRSGTYPLRPAQGQNEKHDTAWNWDRYNDWT